VLSQIANGPTISYAQTSPDVFSARHIHARYMLSSVRPTGGSVKTVEVKIMKFSPYDIAPSL